jgi:hypothetical protein
MFKGISDDLQNEVYTYSEGENVRIGTALCLVQLNAHSGVVISFQLIRLRSVLRGNHLHRRSKRFRHLHGVWSGSSYLVKLEHSWCILTVSYDILSP